MKKQLVLVLVLLTLTLGSYAQSTLGSGSSLTLTVEGAKVQATWEAETHDFGEIPQGEPVRYTFHVLNTGNQPLKLERVKPSCGCTATDYTQEPIAPGEKGHITATYNAAATGYFSKSIVVTTNVEEQPNTILRFTGEVVAKEGP
jgi:hypothetical protein